MRKFGCVHKPSPLDSGYLANRHLSFEGPFGASDIFSRSKEWEFDTILDQGDSMACTAFAASSLVAAAPRRRAQPDPWSILAKQYAIDDMIHSPVDQGSTPRAAMAVLKAQGYIGSYLWCQTAAEAWEFILNHGPVLIAIPWYQEMTLTADDGTITVPSDLHTAESLGGHCMMVNGVNGDRKAFRGPNSFGTTYGQNGRYWMNFDDLDRLLNYLGSMVGAPVDKIVVPQ